MWGYLSLLPVLLAIWAIGGLWTVFSVAVANKSVNLTQGFPYISICGNQPPQSCIFSQVLNLGAALATWICILRYYQLRDWGVGKWPNRLILWTGLLSALGTSIVGNFQLLFLWRMKSVPRPGAPWIGPLRLGLCSICTILTVAMVVLHVWRMRSVSAALEWTVAMLLFVLFGLFAVDFSGLDGCTLRLRPCLGPLSPPPASPVPLQVSL
ncbi:modulator of macroautophagy TMEM150B isoform X2 [Phacochoerus africanus]|uniref:modulator of macroautophagy TMEM150B isoform X2 n=1 Tax=Phacochoerus africanus TaxID=41426 RepID=UPI001FD8BCDD|nr:modulator of macroautophagy TMEM150B isoform X2 [Phacochoerus africanus]